MVRRRDVGLACLSHARLRQFPPACVGHAAHGRLAPTKRPGGLPVDFAAQRAVCRARAWPSLAGRYGRVGRQRRRSFSKPGRSTPTLPEYGGESTLRRRDCACLALGTPLLRQVPCRPRCRQLCVTGSPSFLLLPARRQRPPRWPAATSILPWWSRPAAKARPRQWPGIDELWRRHIIRQYGQVYYEFTHDQLRQVAYASISPERRRWLHEQIAEVLAHAHAADPESMAGQIAHHYTLSGHPEKALDYCLLAAGAASRIFANGEAIAFFQQAQSLLPENDHADDRRTGMARRVAPSPRQLAGITARCYVAALDAARRRRAAAPRRISR